MTDIRHARRGLKAKRKRRLRSIPLVSYTAPSRPGSTFTLQQPMGLMRILMRDLLGHAF